ncbi:MAG: pyridoxal phosphate-dependent aminotransferase [Acidobacteria bacterium]|nr:pyridoxal phosphate-dependent aminotransferase [Acidobacteriota bacterium]
MQLSRHAVEAKDSLIRQIATLAEQVDKPYKLYFGESDMQTPEFICRAAWEAMRDGHTFYTNSAGYLDLRRAIVEKFHEVHGVQYKPTEVICTAGAVMAIAHSIRAVVDPGDNVLIVQPGWPVFSSILTLVGAEARSVRLLRTSDGFKLDLEQVRNSIDNRTKMLIVNSPSNPTGWVISESEQRALWDLALKHDFVILSDEVYDRIVFDREKASSFASVATDHDHLIVINSFSKTYNMTGWRLGYALTSEHLAKLMTKLQEFVVSNPAAMVQRAGIVALRDGEPYIKEIRDKYARQRQLTIEKLRSVPNISLPVPQGGFYAFPQIEGLQDSLGFAKKLLLEGRVGMAPGIAFGAAGEGYMRMCFAASDAVLVPALDRFKEFVQANLCD